MTTKPWQSKCKPAPAMAWGLEVLWPDTDGYEPHSFYLFRGWAQEELIGMRETYEDAKFRIRKYVPEA